MKLTTLLKLITVSLWLTLLYACSDDRLKPIEKETATDDTPVKTDDNPDDISKKKFGSAKAVSVLGKLAEKTTKYTIKNMSELPIVTSKGTKIWIYEYNVRSSNGGAVRYPFDIEIVELFKLKDMVLHQKPTTSFDRVLVTAGAFYLNVSKDGQGLVPDRNMPPMIIVQPTIQKLDNSMRLFYGSIDRQGEFTWIAAPVDSTQNPQQTKENPPPLVANRTEYEIFPRNFGWINCDKFLNSPLPLTSVKFTSVYPKLNDIVIFMVLPEMKSVIRVYDGQSLSVPIGEKVKIVAVAETEDREIFSLFKDIKVEKDQTVEIKLIKTTEKDFFDAIEKL